MSRRAQKKLSTFTSGSWSLTSSTSYIYDGWNLVKEQSTINNQPSTSFYVWGLDLSGSLQGAGGIGGLLARVKDGSVQQYIYDGNGNVSELVDGNGNIVSHYEYDPYGNLVKADGALAQNLMRLLLTIVAHGSNKLLRMRGVCFHLMRVILIWGPV